MTGPRTGRVGEPAPTAGEQIMAAVGRAAWAFRVELGLLLAVASAWLAVTWQLLGHPHGAALRALRHGPGLLAAARMSAVLTAVVVAVLVLYLPTRRVIGRLLVRASVRRRLLRALTRLDLLVIREHSVRVVKVARTSAGWRVRLHLPPGASGEDFDRAAERIAVAMRLRQVTVVRDQHVAALIDVCLDVRDPLAGPPMAWPWLDARAVDLRSPVPVAIDQDGQLVTIDLAERSLLLGGEPGAGKSNAIHVLVAAAALNPAVRLHLLDGKWVELAVWAPIADTVVGPDARAAAAALAGLRAVMDERYRELLLRGQRKVTAGDGLPVHLVVIDELALYLDTGDRAADGEIAGHLRDLVSRGRAAGVIVLAATQKPSTEVVPSQIRDQFSMRWAMRCATPHASDTILGAGRASAGHNAATIDLAQRGVGYLLTEGAVPTRCRAFHLSDEELAELAGRAAAIRGIPRPAAGAIPVPTDQDGNQ